MLQSIKNVVRVLLPVRLREWISIVRNRGQLVRGKGSRVHRSAQILGRANVRIGNNSCVSERCWLNVNHRRVGEVAISIGDNTFIGRSNFITSGGGVFVGDYCLTTMDCKFISSTHNADTPWLPIVTTGTTSHDVIKVGSNCFFGAGATVLGHVEIGHGSVIGAHSLVMNDVPPFSLVVGSPARVVKRYSFKRHAWIPVKELALDDLCENPDCEAYLQSLRSASPRVDMPWIASGADQGSF